MKTPSPAKTNTLQTLDRGLQVLALIATRAGGWSIAELATAPSPTGWSPRWSSTD